VPHKVWLTDKKKMEKGDDLKDAEKNVDKNIFRHGSPKKSSKNVRRVAEDPGPHRPTTAKRRDGRPSSAERNRGETVKPSIWLDHISRDSKAGARSFIECNPSQNRDRPNSADRKRKQPKSEKKKKTRAVVSPSRPSSAERTRGDKKINNAVWLEGRSDGGNNIERPSSAGRRRDGALTDNNQKPVDQNGRPRSAEKIRPKLAPLKGVTPVKNVEKAAEV